MADKTLNVGRRTLITGAAATALAAVTQAQTPPAAVETKLVDIPLGTINSDEFGPSRLASFDAEIERLERSRRKFVSG